MATALTISNSNGSVTVVSPIDLYTAGVYYHKRLNIGATDQKNTIDSSPNANGAFIRRYGPHTTPINGGELIIVQSSHALVRQAYLAIAADGINSGGGIRNILNTLTMVDEGSNQTQVNCECVRCELKRRPPPDSRSVIGSGAGWYRAYVAIDFLQITQS